MLRYKNHVQGLTIVIICIDVQVRTKHSTKEEKTDGVEKDTYGSVPIKKISLACNIRHSNFHTGIKFLIFTYVQIHRQIRKWIKRSTTDHKFNQKYKIFKQLN